MTRLPVMVTKVDMVSDTLLYVGKAAAGSPTADSVWQIRQIDLTGNDVDIKYAGGVGTYNFSWDGRASHTYTG